MLIFIQFLCTLRLAKHKEKVCFLTIIYSWTFKLLMRTNEVVFRSVSMKYAYQNDLV